MRLDLSTLSETASTNVEAKIARLVNAISLGRIHGTITDMSTSELLGIAEMILIEAQKRESHIVLLKNNYDALDKAHLVSSNKTQNLLDVINRIGKSGLYQEKNGKWYDVDTLIADNTKDLIDYFTELNSKI